MIKKQKSIIYVIANWPHLIDRAARKDVMELVEQDQFPHSLQLAGWIHGGHVFTRTQHPAERGYNLELAQCKLTATIILLRLQVAVITKFWTYFVDESKEIDSFKLCRIQQVYTTTGIGY